MSFKSTWKGHLKVSLLSVPIKVYSAINGSEKIAFNNLHKTCKNRINQKTVCLHCLANDLKAEDLLKGYEIEKGKFVTFTAEEIAAVKVESNHTINITAFVPPSDIDPLLLDAPYYLAPETKTGFARQAFATLLKAMGDKVGVGKVAIREKEYVVAIRAQQRGIVMHTMLRPAELRTMDAIEELQASMDANEDEVALAKGLVDQYTRPVDLASFTDEYTENLRAMIEAKAQGKTFTAAAIPVPQSSSNLLEALKASLKAAPAPVPTAQTLTIAAVTTAKTKTAKASLKTTGRKRVAV